MKTSLIYGSRKVYKLKAESWKVLERLIYQTTTYPETSLIFPNIGEEFQLDRLQKNITLEKT